MTRPKLMTACLLACTLGISAQSLKTANKQDTDKNPLIPYNLCADPTAVEYDGRLYVYGTNDQLEYDTTKDKTKNTYGKINQLVCISSADLVNWTFHAPIKVKSLAPWSWTSWAPSVVCREESDGKTHFYLYYTNGASGIGVLTATSPTGPWRDPIGRALIDGSTAGRGEQSNIIDPGVCIDENGDGWLTFGGGDPNRSGTKLMPGNARIVKLGKNMTSLSGKIYVIPAPFHFEANELNYENGKYIFSYSGGWSCNDSDWSGYKGKNGYACPTNCSIMSMITDDPTTGEWTYTGEILKNPGTFGYPWGNNHSHVQKYDGKYYMLYHTQKLEQKMGLSGGYRGIAIDKIALKRSPVTFAAAKMTDLGPDGLKEKSPVASDGTVIEAETMANSAGIIVKWGSSIGAVADVHKGDWTMIRNVSFPDGAKSVKLKLHGKGSLELRSGKNSTLPLAKVDFDCTTGWKTYHVDMEKVLEPGKSLPYLYFVFTDATGSVTFDNYSFHSTTVGETTGISSVESEGSSLRQQEVFSVDGKRTGTPSSKGLYIVNGKKVVKGE